MLWFGCACLWLVKEWGRWGVCISAKFCVNNRERESVCVDRGVWSAMGWYVRLSVQAAVEEEGSLVLGFVQSYGRS